MEKGTKAIEAEGELWFKADNFWRALYDLKAVVAGFSGKKELDVFLNTLWDTYSSIRDDPDLKQWFCDFHGLVDRLLDHPDLSSTEVKNETNELFKRGRELLNKEKWTDQFNALSCSYYCVLENIRKDETTQEFGERIKKFTQDLFLNRQGYPDLFVMEDSLVQMKNLLIPLFKEQLEQIKIGKAEFHNETYDVKIEDISFGGTFLPEHIDLHILNDTHLDTADTLKNTVRQVLQFKISTIKPEFNNFKFHYLRKSFPKIEDWGMADMKITGAGASINVTWTITASQGNRPVAELKDVTCDIDKLQIKIVGKKTHHEILDKMMLPFFRPTIKNKIANTIEDLLRNRLLDMNSKINEFFQSNPLEAMTEKTNEVLQEGFKKIQQSSISVV